MKELKKAREDLMRTDRFSTVKFIIIWVLMGWG
jgi:hypothetical protein